MNRPRECPFCGGENLDRNPETTVCNICGVEHINEWWDERWDDWRSDGWPVDTDMLMRHNCGWINSDVIGDGHVITHCFNCGKNVPLSECKWKPLPASEGGIDET